MAPDTSRQINTRLAPETYRWVRELAEREHRSVAAQVKLIVERARQEANGAS